MRVLRQQPLVIARGKQRLEDLLALIQPAGARERVTASIHYKRIASRQADRSSRNQ